MSYARVIPRDLFNEAGLLKCWGQMYLNLEALGLHDCIVEEDIDAGFMIDQDEDSGAIFLVNVFLALRDHTIIPVRPLNSRRPYPLWIYQGDDEIPVFDDKGVFTEEMLIFLGKRESNDA